MWLRKALPFIDMWGHVVFHFDKSYFYRVCRIAFYIDWDHFESCIKTTSNMGILHPCIIRFYKVEVPNSIMDPSITLTFGLFTGCHNSIKRFHKINYHVIILVLLEFVISKLVWSSIIIGDKHAGHKLVQNLRKVAHGTFLKVRTWQNPICDLQKLAFPHQNAKVGSKWSPAIPS